MLKDIFNYESRSITGAAILLGMAGLASRVIGLFRDRLFAHYFGAGETMDAYYAAFRIPDFIFNVLLAGAITAGFIPVFLELRKKQSGEAWNLVSNCVTLMAGLTALVSIIAFVFARSITEFITPGFSESQLEQTVLFTKIMLLSPLLLGVSGVVSSVLHAFRQFAIFSLAPIVYNIAIIASTVFFVPIFGVTALAWGVVAGAALHLAVQLPALYSRGFRYRFIFKSFDYSVREVVRLVIPRGLGLVAVQMNSIVLTGFASFFGAGSIAIFNLAHNLYYVPIGLIGHAFALAAFPVFSSAATENKMDELGDHFSRVVRQTLFLIIPATMLVIMLRAQIVRVVLGSGKFDWTDTVLTADTLAILAISLGCHCIMLITARALFAMKCAWPTWWVAGFGVLITAGIGWALSGNNDVRVLGIALSSSIMAQTALLWFIVRQKIPRIREKEIIRMLAKISAGVVALAITGQGAKTLVGGAVDMTRLWGILSQGAVSATVGILAYGTVCYLLKLEEMELFKDSFKKRWLKIREVSEI